MSTEESKQPTNPRYVRTGHVEGEWVTMNGIKFEVPALNFRQVRQMRQKLKDLRLPTTATAENADDETMAKFFEIVHAALSRNYAKLELEDMEELIDLRNLVPVVKAAMNVSGLVQLGEMMGTMVPAPTTTSSTGT